MVTPLLLSAAGGHHEIVRLLLTNGVAVDHMDIVRNAFIDLSFSVLMIYYLQEGNTALMFAAAGTL